MSEPDVLNDRELSHLETSSGDDCDMASVRCVVRELRAYREGLRVIENNADHDGDLLRTVYLTGFERMVIECWRDRLATDDTIDRTLIEILGKLAGPTT